MSAAQAAAVLLITLVVGLGTALWRGQRLLSQPAAVAAIRDSHLGGFLPKVTAEQIDSLLTTPGVTLVDARLPKDFQEGHLEGAINLPPRSDPDSCKRAMASVPISQKVVVYCYSNGCTSSEFVARRLIALGYENVVWFRDGWAGWQRFKQSAGR